MTEISKQKILKLSNDYIGDWLDVQTHRQVVTDDNLDSSIVLVKISNIFVGDYHAVADKLLISPFVAFIYAEYARDLGYILRALNEPYATLLISFILIAPSIFLDSPIMLQVIIAISSFS